MLAEFAKSILVGLVASIPLGPVAMIVIRKTVQHGRRAGFVTGIGAALVDTLYATIGVLAIAVISHFIQEHNYLITVGGGIIVTFIGAVMAFRDPFKGMKGKSEIVNKTSASYTAQGAMLSLANPGALVLMLALIAFFKVGTGSKILTVAGVLTGGIVWWWMFSYLVHRFVKNLNINTLVMINKITGIGVAIFGIIWMVRAFLIIG